MNPIRVYYSFRSPFAAIAMYRLRRIPDFAEYDIRLMPVWPELLFGGHIDNPSDNLFKMAYIFGDAARHAELAGLDRSFFDGLASRFQLPEDADYRQAKVGVPMGEERWEIPHSAALYAAREGKAWAFADLVFHRRFGFDGRPPVDVQQPGVVAELAAQLGLDGELAAGAWQDESIAQEVQAIVKQGERDGAFGVPFFAVDRDDGVETFWGNDRIEHVLKFVRGDAALPRIDAADLTALRN